MSEICRVFRMALKIPSGCLSSEENDKQTYHDIALPSMTHHSYFPCYNKIAPLCFQTLRAHMYVESVMHTSWITLKKIAFFSVLQSIFF